MRSLWEGNVFSKVCLFLLGTPPLTALAPLPGPRPSIPLLLSHGDPLVPAPRPVQTCSLGNPSPFLVLFSCFIWSFGGLASYLTRVCLSQKSCVHQCRFMQTTVPANDNNDDFTRIHFRLRNPDESITNLRV